MKSDQFKTIEDLKIYLSKTKHKNIIFLHSLGSISLIVNVIIIYFKILTNFLLIKKKIYLNLEIIIYIIYLKMI